MGGGGGGREKEQREREMGEKNGRSGKEDECLQTARGKQGKMRKGSGLAPLTKVITEFNFLAWNKVQGIQRYGIHGNTGLLEIKVAKFVDGKELKIGNR